MAANLPLGTYISDGVRVGPEFNSSDYTNFGKGVLLSTQHSYNIFTAAPNPVGGFTNENNVVAATTVAAGGGYLTLRGDNFVTFLTTGDDGLPLLQLDQPRVISATIAVANPTAGTHVTIFGNDMYGFSMQHTYILNANQGKYPTFNFPGGAVSPTMTFPGDANNHAAKAFYQITKVFISAALPGGGTISLGAMDAFGLPYVINGFNDIAGGTVLSSGTSSSGVISSIAWGNQEVDNAHPILPIGDLTLRVIGSALDTDGFLAAADLTTPATAFSGDVRGFYATSTPSAIQYTAIDTLPVLNSTNLIFTYFVAGSDNSIDQEASAQQNLIQASGQSIPAVPTNLALTQGVPVVPLTLPDSVGVKQFYTGIPT